jgi:hypothetical protein
MTPMPAADLAKADGPTLFLEARDFCLSKMADLVAWNERAGCGGPARQQADMFEAIATVFDTAIKSRGRATLKDLADAARETAKAAAARRQFDAKSSDDAGTDQPNRTGSPDEPPQR